MSTETVYDTQSEKNWWDFDFPRDFKILKVIIEWVNKNWAAAWLWPGHAFRDM